MMPEGNRKLVVRVEKETANLKIIFACEIVK